MRIKGFFHLLAQSLCRLRLFATPQTAACQVSLSFTISQNLLKLISIESLVSPNCLILCRPLLLSSIFPSTRVCSDEVVLSIKWPKYRNLSFGITSSSFNISQFNSDFVCLMRTPVTLVGAPFQCRVQSYHRRVVLLAILVLKKRLHAKRDFICIFLNFQSFLLSSPIMVLTFRSLDQTIVQMLSLVEGPQGSYFESSFHLE